MDWNRVETLLNADPERVAAKASNARAALAALDNKIRAEVSEVESALSALQERLDALPAAISEQQAVITRCDAIIAKAKVDERPDLAMAAGARRAQCVAKITGFEAEGKAGEAELDRLDDALTRLGDKQIALEGHIASLPDEPAASVAASAPAPAPVALAPPGAASKATALAVPGAAANATAPKATGGGDDLDAQFAELLAGMGDLGADAAKPARLPAPPAAADDDDDLGIPELVEVAEGELPEGADPDAKGPIDFSALDALGGPGPGKAASKGALVPAAKAGLPAVKGQAGVPAVAVKAGVPAVKGQTSAPALAAKAGAPAASGSRKTLWMIVGATVVLGGGVVLALRLLGKL